MKYKYARNRYFQNRFFLICQSYRLFVSFFFALSSESMMTHIF